MLRNSTALPGRLARDMCCRKGSGQCGLQFLPFGLAANCWGARPEPFLNFHLENVHSIKWKKPVEFAALHKAFSLKWVVFVMSQWVITPNSYSIVLWVHIIHSFDSARCSKHVGDLESKHIEHCESTAKKKKSTDTWWRLMTQLQMNEPGVWMFGPTFFGLVPSNSFVIISIIYKVIVYILLYSFCFALPYDVGLSFSAGLATKRSLR